MVAEAVREEPITQPEAEAVTPEIAEETAPAPEPEVVDDIATDVLKELGLGDVATPADTSDTAPANETEADPYAGLSPQEIAKKVREEVDEETKATTSSREYQSYVNGVSRSFQDTFNELDRKADELDLDADSRKWLKDRFATFNGHWDVLFKYAVENDRGAQREGMKQALINAAKKAGIESVDFPSADDFITKLTEHVKAGAVTESKAKERERDAAAAAVKAYRKRLTAAGVDIPGVRVAEVPNNPGNGAGGQPKNYTEAEAWHASGKWDNNQMRAYKATHSRE